MEKIINIKLTEAEAEWLEEVLDDEFNLLEQADPTANADKEEVEDWNRRFDLNKSISWKVFNELHKEASKKIEDIEKKNNLKIR